MLTEKMMSQVDIPMFKSQLEEYAQKAGHIQPVYESFKEGPSHEPKFRASVSVNGNIYESLPGFATLKAAEHAAAKVALDALLQSGCRTGVAPSSVHESGLCKNILQEHAQKSCLPLPVYRSVRSGQEHAPMFTSTVDIGGMLYTGGPAKNKKEAEIKAARTALIAIQGESRPSGMASESSPDIAQGQLGSSSVIKSSPANGLKKRGRELRSESKTRSAAKLKKKPVEERLVPAQENDQNIQALSSAPVSASLGSLSVPVS